MAGKVCSIGNKFGFYVDGKNNQVLLYLNVLPGRASSRAGLFIITNHPPYPDCRYPCTGKSVVLTYDILSSSTRSNNEIP